VPEEISTMIEVLEKKFSPVRDLVKVVKVGTGDYKELVNIRGTTSGWVGESTSRTATDASLLRERAPTNGELYAYPQASEWSLDDMFFNVEEWLAEEVAQSFAVAEGLAVISGNGTNSPTGMLNTPPVATADFASPLRAAAAYQFIPSLTSLSPAAAEILPDALIDLIYALNSTYRSGAQFIMNSNTIGAVRKLKDTNGQYHWQPGLQQGQPDKLLGYGLSPWEQMPDIGTNALPIGFGNWKRAYVLAERIGLRMTRDNVTTIGFVKFYMRRREGGTVLNNDAAKFLKTTIA
jgi:HK97 family phage major capsid protein